MLHSYNCILKKMKALNIKLYIRVSFEAPSYYNLKHIFTLLRLSKDGYLRG